MTPRDRLRIHWIPSPRSLIRKIRPNLPAHARLSGAWEDPERIHRCLRCLEPLARKDRRVQTCRHCGLLNTPFLRRQYWNLSEPMVRLSLALRVVLVLLAIPLTLEAGCWFPVPVLVLWFTVSKLTEYVPSFPAAIVWSLPAGFFGLLAAVDARWLLAVVLGCVAVLILVAGHYGKRWRETRRRKIFGLDGPLEAAEEARS